MASSPALQGDSGPERLGKAAHSPTAALAGAGTRVPWEAKHPWESCLQAVAPMGLPDVPIPAPFPHSAPPEGLSTLR